MVDTPGGEERTQDLAQRLGIEKGMVVQEVGWDEDCDSSISEAIEDVIGEELLDADTDELCDVVLLWWREDDGDLVDGLVDSITPLADGGCIWLLTPGAQKPGTVEPGVTLNLLNWLEWCRRRLTALVIGRPRAWWAAAIPSPKALQYNVL